MAKRTVKDNEGKDYAVIIKWEPKHKGWHVYLDNEPVRFVSHARVAFPTAQNIVAAAFD